MQCIGLIIAMTNKMTTMKMVVVVVVMTTMMMVKANNWQSPVAAGLLYKSAADICQIGPHNPTMYTTSFFWLF